MGCDNLNIGVAEHRRGRDRAVKSRGSADGGRLSASKSVTWIGLSGIVARGKMTGLLQRLTIDAFRQT